MEGRATQRTGRGGLLYDISYSDTSKNSYRAVTSNYVYYSYASKIKNSLRLG